MVVDRSDLLSAVHLVVCCIIVTVAERYVWITGCKRVIWYRVFLDA